MNVLMHYASKMYSFFFQVTLRDYIMATVSIIHLNCPRCSKEKTLLIHVLARVSVEKKKLLIKIAY